jgi:hypothetical protein
LRSTERRGHPAFDTHSGVRQYRHFLLLELLSQTARWLHVRMLVSIPPKVVEDPSQLVDRASISGGASVQVCRT